MGRSAPVVAPSAVDGTAALHTQTTEKVDAHVDGLHRDDISLESVNDTAAASPGSDDFGDNADEDLEELDDEEVIWDLQNSTPGPLPSLPPYEQFSGTLTPISDASRADLIKGLAAIVAVDLCSGTACIACT